jgi:hypothetical protein
VEALEEQYDVEAVSRRAAAPNSPSPDEGRVRQRWVAGGCRRGLTAHALRDWCLENPWSESFNARLRDEVLDTELISSLAEAKLILAEWLEAERAVLKSLANA